jgi:alkylation response protein AidB-like acyl-CoA dehydrogenase
MMADGDAGYRPTEEYLALREAVRALAEKEIAPHAADVDERELGRWRRTMRWSVRAFTPCTCPRSTAGRARMRWRRAS